MWWRNDDGVFSIQHSVPTSSASLYSYELESIRTLIRFAPLESSLDRLIKNKERYFDLERLIRKKILLTSLDKLEFIM